MHVWIIQILMRMGKNGSPGFAAISPGSPVHQARQLEPLDAQGVPGAAPGGDLLGYLVPMRRLSVTAVCELSRRTVASVIWQPVVKFHGFRLGDKVAPAAAATKPLLEPMKSVKARDGDHYRPVTYELPCVDAGMRNHMRNTRW